ncbi:hypothetical protein LARI1_G009464, partial [Lachnellula arida]
LPSVTKIYDTVIYPNNLAFLANGSSVVPSGLFNVNASGRVDPVGNFTGFDDSTEYFFGLSPVPSLPSYTAFTSAPIVSFTSGCASVAASVVYLDTTVVNPNATNNGDFVTVLKEVAFWHFDDDGAVLYYDAWIPNLAEWTSVAQGGLDFTNSIIQEVVIAEELCPAIQDRCVGDNQQYANTLDCIAQLSLKKFGSFDEVWGDDITCRTIHVILTQIRPEVHCPHVGPTGGGKCVDVNYTTVYAEDDVALFGGPEGSVFNCPTDS